MTQDERARELFDRAFRPPAKPYDLGRAMAEARAAWAQSGCVPLDPPDTWTVTPIPVEPDDETP
jgi:hypothetical protein